MYQKQKPKLKKKLRIGIDLDNTIIDYSNAFKKINYKFFDNNKKINKKKLKIKIEKIFKYKGWSKVQEIIFGKYITCCHPYSGFVNFYQKNLKKKNTLYIVSHKTHLSEYSKKYPIRNKAKSWIFKNIKNIKKNKIFFERTLQNKVKRIKKLKLDIFIDDMYQVFTHEEFDKKCQKILFKDKKKNLKCFNSWNKIYAYINE